MKKTDKRSESVEVMPEKVVLEPIHNPAEKSDGKIKPEGRIKCRPLPPPPHKPINETSIVFQ